jgi:transposase
MSLEPHAEPAAIRSHLGAIFVSLELSRSKWLVTSVSPGGGEKMSKHSLVAGDTAGLLSGFGELRGKALARTERSYPNLRQALELVRTGDGRPLEPHLKAQIGRELDRLELLMEQIAAVESERDAMLSLEARAEPQASTRRAVPAPVAMLAKLKCIGPEFAAVLWTEGLCRSFANRRQVASFAGLTPSPWQSGSIKHEHGVSKAGNPRLRTMMIQLAWLWVRHQPQSELTHWFRYRFANAKPDERKSLIVALARKLLVALWKYAIFGVVIEGAAMKPAAAG